MFERFTWIAVVMAAVVLMFGVPAYADHYFCGSHSSDWGTLANWKTNAGCTVDALALPSSADKVIISSGTTCNVNIGGTMEPVAECRQMVVDGTLNVQANKRMKLNPASEQTSTITGAVYLQGSSADMSIEVSEHTFTGTGKIVGQHNDGKISIAVGRTLQNDVIIEGKLRIVGDGTFINKKTVHANVDGTLYINSQFVDDVAGALWKVAITVSGTPVLHWNPTDIEWPVLAGDFEVVNGLLEVSNLGFDTTGKLTQTGGRIELDDEGTFVEFSDENTSSFEGEP